MPVPFWEEFRPKEVERVPEAADLRDRVESLPHLVDDSCGLDFALGSGDDDPMSGDGNVTKIRTQGFFYVNEIWEDSIMPDEQGITPQGLGSPGSRGYREFENTTLGQLNASIAFGKEWNVFLSATLIGAASSKDLGRGTGLQARLEAAPGPHLVAARRGPLRRGCHRLPDQRNQPLPRRPLGAADDDPSQLRRAQA